MGEKKVMANRKRKKKLPTLEVKEKEGLSHLKQGKEGAYKNWKN